MKKAIITVGLGFGDEGKGATVDFLCREYKADLVVRYSGGSQCGHNVQLPDGKRHTFSQFGSGTLAGVTTYLGPHVIVNLGAMLKEAEHLEELGVDRPLYWLTIDPNCLITTPYHRALNKLKEIARGKKAHGSCGHGIGETRSYWLKYGRDALCVGDWETKRKMLSKLELIQARLFDALQELEIPETAEALECLEEFDTSPKQVMSEELSILGTAGLYRQAPSPSGDIVIFEGAQGILLDEYHGFHPYTTWSTVTSKYAKEIALAENATEIKVIGITRTYLTRHGAGPLPTYNSQLTKQLTERDDLGNPHNRWQGDVKCGWLDLLLMKYAVRANGGIDGIALNCLDERPLANVWSGLSWDIQTMEDLGPLTAKAPNLKRQEELAQKLLVGWDGYAVFGSEEESRKELEKIAPIVIESRGKTYQHRKITCGSVL